MSELSNKPIPQDALSFAAPITFAAAGGDEPRRRKFSGVAYSGDVIKPHYYWGAVIFDLATTTVDQRIPVLIEHDRAQRAGFASLTIGTDRIDIGDGVLIDESDAGHQVITEADAGFPWQLSIHIEPEVVHFIDTGTTATVNGRTVSGPCHIFKNSRIREVSFTPTGADHRTSATVFTHTTPEVPVMSDPNAERIEKLTQQVTQLSAQVQTLTTERDTAVTERDTARTELNNVQMSTRKDAVKTLFTAIGREFTDDAAKPYLAMPADQFAAVSADLQAARPAPNLPANLFNEQATGGAVQSTDPNAIVLAAQQFQAKAKAEGRDIPLHEAIRFVTKKAA